MSHHRSRTLPLAWGLIAVVAASLISCAIAPPQAQTAPATDLTEPTPAPSPLIAATLANDITEVRSLLASGTDPNQVYHTNTALTYAARDGFTGIARLLLDYGAEVNWIDGEGVTPLILAAFKGHTELAQLLLDHGADPTIVDQWHRTALDYALRRGEADAIAQMLQRLKSDSE